MSGLINDASNSEAGLHLKETARILADQEWFSAVVNSWPAPIAHEVNRLHEMLASGFDAGGALFQMRDTAEVLLKTVVLVYARDLQINAPELRDQITSILAIPKISLGKWVGVLRDLSHLIPAAPEQLIAGELRRLGVSTDDFHQAMSAYVERRNRDLGHGAFRKDSVEIAEAVREQLVGVGKTGSKPGIVTAFAEVADIGVWDRCELRVGSEDGAPFTGMDAIERGRTYLGRNQVHVEPLVLVSGDRSVPLSPLLAKRACRECGHLDAFIYDFPDSLNPKKDSVFAFLDYSYGHRLRVKVSEEQDSSLSEIINGLDSSEFLKALKEKPKGEFTTDEIVKLLDDVMFDTRYARPEWIRSELVAHMTAHEGGIFWLEAPAHVGKTMFIRGIQGDGLTKKQRAAERNLLGDYTSIELLPIYLKREYRFNPRQFCNAMRALAMQHLKKDTSRLVELSPIGEPDTIKRNFTTFAAQAFEASGSKRLIIAIDGLDELPAPGERNDAAPEATSPVDFIPDASDMPPGVTLLITSRRLDSDECPAWLSERLSDWLASQTGSFAHLSATTETPSYVDLLRSYVAKHSGVAADDPDFEEVWSTILRKSEGLFLFVSFFCDLIRDQISDK